MLVAFSEVFTFMDDTSCLHQGWALPLQPTAVLDGGNQLFVCWVAFLQSGHVPVQSPGPAVGPAWGARGLAVGSSPGLGEAPPCCPAAVVRQGEGANATVQGVRGGPRAWEKWIIAKTNKQIAPKAKPELRDITYSSSHLQSAGSEPGPLESHLRSRCSSNLIPG